MTPIEGKTQSNTEKGKTGRRENDDGRNIRIGNQSKQKSLTKHKMVMTTHETRRRCAVKAYMSMSDTTKHKQESRKTLLFREETIVTNTHLSE